MKNLIPYGKQTISKEDINGVIKCLRSNYLTTGPNTEIFENNFKRKFGSKFSVSCSSGTAALHLALLSIKLKKNDVVILPVVNFIASVNMSYNLGAKIYFADVDHITGQMTPNNLLNCIKKNKIKKIKAVITMYNAGNPNNAYEFYKLKKKYNFFLIEDACHALGAKYSIKKNINIGCCKYSDITTFSFHPVKSLTTGEGGMITTNSRIIFERARTFRNHGMVRKQNTISKYNWDYKIVLPGYNYRLSDINCSLGISQLKKLNNFIRNRMNVFNLYKKKLNNLSELISLPEKNKDQQSGNHLFIINLKISKLKISRDIIIQKLFKQKIITQVHYIPIFKQPFYKKSCKGSFPGASSFFKTCLSLPIYPELSNQKISYICSKIKNILEKNKKLI